jgi:hypothetical protein
LYNYPFQPFSPALNGAGTGTCTNLRTCHYQRILLVRSAPHRLQCRPLRSGVTGSISAPRAVRQTPFCDVPTCIRKTEYFPRQARDKHGKEKLREKGRFSQAPASPTTPPGTAAPAYQMRQCCSIAADPLCNVVGHPRRPAKLETTSTEFRSARASSGNRALQGPGRRGRAAAAAAAAGRGSTALFRFLALHLAFHHVAHKVTGASSTRS